MILGKLPTAHRAIIQVSLRRKNLAFGDGERLEELAPLNKEELIKLCIARPKSGRRLLDDSSFSDDVSAMVLAVTTTSYLYQ